MELRKAYADIVEKASYQWLVADNTAREVFEGIVTACQELADRPPRELTDAEIAVHSRTFARGDYTDYDFARAIEAAAHAKQREPQVVKFRAARYKTGQRIEMFSDLPNEHWEWLEPAQEFEVRI